MTLTYYSFHPSTGEYRSSRHAPIDPLETKANNGVVVFRGPGRFETTVPPPPRAARQAACHVDGEWTLVPDHRGETWWKARGRPVKIKGLGNPASEGLTRTEPELSLAEFRAEAYAAVLEASEARRSAIASSYPTQNDVYQLKAELALVAKNPSHPDVATAQALLSAEAAARGVAGWEALADQIIAKRSQWTAWAMGIETIRAAAEVDIANALTRDAITAARDAAIGAIGTIGE